MEAVSPAILLELTIKPFLFLTPRVLLNRKEGAACKGEGRSTCQKGEFCRESVCTKVNLKVNYIVNINKPITLQCKVFLL